MLRHPPIKNSNLVLVVLLVLFVAAGWLLRSVYLGRQRERRVTELTGLIGTRHHSGAVAFSPDGKTLALPKVVDGRVELWKLGSGSVRILVSRFSNNHSPARDVVFSNDGRSLAVHYQDSWLSVWDVHAQKEKAHLPLTHPSALGGMAFTDNDKSIIVLVAKVSDRDNDSDHWNYSAIRWDFLTARTQIVTVFDPSLRVMALSPNGRHSVLANSLEQAVFEVATGKKIIALNDSGGVCFSTNGLTLVAYNGNEVSLWDISSGKQFRRFAFNSSYLTPGYVNTDCLSMSPDKKLLAVGWFTKMNTVGIISLESGKLLDTFECGPPLMMCSTVNFSPTGRMFATDTDSVDNNDREAEPLLRFWKIPDSW